MQKRIFLSIVIAALWSPLCFSCGDKAQEAAENANRDTVPVIETQPSRDSVKTDSPNTR